MARNLLNVERDEAHSSPVRRESATYKSQCVEVMPCDVLVDGTTAGSRLILLEIAGESPVEPRRNERAGPFS